MQELVVALAVAAAIAWLCVKYMPKQLRARLATRLSAHPRLVRWIGTDASCASGCDTCGACDTEAAPETAPREHAIKLHRRS